MRYIKISIAVLILSLSFFACKQKQMTLEDYAKIDIEITTTDLKPESIKKITEKYGYSVDQYNKFDQKIQNDPALQEKLGEIRLNNLKPKK